MRTVERAQAERRSTLRSERILRQFIWLETLGPTCNLPLLWKENRIFYFRHKD